MSERNPEAHTTGAVAPQEHVGEVLGELVDSNGGTDDVAVPVVRLMPAPLRLDLPAQPVRLAEVRRAVLRWALAAGLPADVIEDLQLTLGEAAGNAVEHAYRDADVAGRVIVELHLDDADVVVSVTDTGAWRPPPADRGFRGRGLRIIAALARDVDLSPGPTGTRLRFVFTPAVPPAAVPGRSPPERRRHEQPATRGSDAHDRPCVHTGRRPRARRSHRDP